MKNLSTDYKNHTALNSTTLCTLVRIVRKDGTEYLFTDFNSDLTVGGKVYKAVNSFVPTDFQSAADLAVDNLDVTGIISEIDDITEEDIYREFFYDGKIWVSTVNYNDPDAGVNKILYGSLGEMVLHENTYSVEFRNLTYILTKNVADVFSKTCRVELGSTKCGVELDPDDWLATTAYCIGDIISPTIANGRRYECSVAGTSDASEPTWNTTVSGTTVETGGVTWITREGFIKEDLVLAPPRLGLWFDHISNPTTYIQVGEIYFYDTDDVRQIPTSCTAISEVSGPCSLFSDSNDTTGILWGGASGADAYDHWARFYFATPFALGDVKVVTVNGTVINDWLIQASYDNVTWFTLWGSGQQTSADWPGGIQTVPAIDITLPGNSSFRPTPGIYADMDYLQDGVVTWLTGQNAGLSMEVKMYDSTEGVIYLFQPMPYNIAFGDTYKVISGCNHLFIGSDGTTATGHCISRYNNGYNFRGEPHVPTEDVLVGGIGETNKAPYQA